MDDVRCSFYPDDVQCRMSQYTDSQIIEAVKTTQMIETQIIEAVKTKNLKVIQSFASCPNFRWNWMQYEVYLNKTAFETVDTKIWNVAAQVGFLEMFQWAIDQAVIRHQHIPSIHLVKLLIEDYHDKWESNSCEWNETTCQYAAKHGHLELLKLLRQYECPMHTFVCEAAAEGGHVQVLQWLRNQTPPCPWGPWTCTYAAGNGQLHVLQWLRSQTPPCPWDEETCSHAASYGHLHVLQWLRSQDSDGKDPYGRPCPWNEDTCTDAATNGFLHILQWLRSQDDGKDSYNCLVGKDSYGRPDRKDSYGRPCPWSNDICDLAAANGYLHILQWIQAHNPPFGWEQTICSSIAQAENDRLDMLKWAMSVGCPLDKNTYKYALHSNNVLILQWALAHGCPVNPNIKSTIKHANNWYDARRWLNNCSHGLFSPFTYEWIQVVDRQTDTLPLPMVLIQLIKHYI